MAKTTVDSGPGGTQAPRSAAVCSPCLSFADGALVIQTPWGGRAVGVLQVNGVPVPAAWEPDRHGRPTCRHLQWRLTVKAQAGLGFALLLGNAGTDAQRLEGVSWARWEAQAVCPRLAALDFRELVHGGSFQSVGSGVKVVGRPGPELDPVAASSMLTVYQHQDGGALLVGILPPLGAAFAELRTLHAEAHLEGAFGFEVVHRFDCEIEPGGCARTAVLIALSGPDGTRLLEQYGKLWGERVAPPAGRPPITGWNSWDHYSGAVTRQDLDTNLAAAAALLPGPGRVLVIDEGWETQWGTWEPNAKFAGGLADYCRHVAAAGWTPGIWTAPLLVNTYNPLYLERPEWFARRADGQPQTDSYSYGPMAYLDPTVPEVLEHVAALFRRLRAADFGYFKVDFAHCILRAVRFRDARVGRNELLRRAFAAIRGAIGPDAYLLSCGAPYESVVGLADGVRLTGDIHIHWGHVLRNAAALSVRWWMQGRLWNGDPDFLVVRGPDTAAPPFGRLQEIKPLGAGYGWCAGRHFTQMEARTWALLVHLSGGDVVLSDPLPQLRPAGLELIRRVATPRVPAAVPVDLFTSEQDLPRIWISRGAQDVLVGLFNWSDRSWRLDFSPAQWHLTGAPRDFWTGSPMDHLPARMPGRSSLALLYPAASACGPGAGTAP